MWLDISPSHCLQVNALVDSRFSALVIGYLHKEQYGSNSLTLFQLIAADGVKPIVNAYNSFHDS